MKEVSAKVTNRDPKTDLTMTKIEGVTGLTAAQLSDSNTTAAGNMVITVGSPQRLGGTVTSGIVSTLSRPVRLATGGTSTDGYADVIRTDISINPGNSGGPLVDIRGMIIGIDTVIFSSSDGSQGLGFIIPINSVVVIAEQLITDE